MDDCGSCWVSISWHFQGGREQKSHNYIASHLQVGEQEAAMVLNQVNRGYLLWIFNQIKVGVFLSQKLAVHLWNRPKPKRKGSSCFIVYCNCCIVLPSVNFRMVQWQSPLTHETVWTSARWLCSGATTNAYLRPGCWWKPMLTTERGRRKGRSLGEQWLKFQPLVSRV